MTWRAVSGRPYLEGALGRDAMRALRRAAGGPAPAPALPHRAHMLLPPAATGSATPAAAVAVSTVPVVLTSPSVSVPPAQSSPVQLGSLWKKQTFQYAFVPKKKPDMLPGKPGKAGKAGKAGKVAGAAGAHGAVNNVFTMVDSFRGNVKYHVNNAIDTVGDTLEEAEERLKEAADDMSSDAKTMLAARTLKLREISARRVQYNRKLKWSSVLYQNLGWFLTAFTWIFGSYVIMAYGVLIYNYLGRAGRILLATSSNAPWTLVILSQMAPYDVASNICQDLNLGPGEEKRYITTWGMAFLLNTFGLESLQIIGRKAFFILVITRFKKSFMKAQESLAGGVLRTGTRLTLSLLLLLHASV